MGDDNKKRLERWKQFGLEHAAWYLPLYLWTILLLWSPSNAGQAFFDWFDTYDLTRFWRMGWFLGIGVPVSQILIGLAREIVARISAVRSVPGGANRWPQRFIGSAETTVYAVAFAYFPAAEVVTGFVAWLTLKSFPTWFRSKEFPETTTVAGQTTQPRQPTQGQDEDPCAGKLDKALNDCREEQKELRQAEETLRKAEQALEKDEPRRRLYIYLLANVLALAFGGLLGTTLERWLLR